MKQVRLNSTMLLSKYEDMLDALISTVWLRPGKLIYSLLSLSIWNYKNIAKISILLFITCFLCNSLVNTVHITAIFLGP